MLWKQYLPWDADLPLQREECMNLQTHLITNHMCKKHVYHCCWNQSGIFGLNLHGTSLEMIDKAVLLVIRTIWPTCAGNDQ